LEPHALLKESITKSDHVINNEANVPEPAGVGVAVVVSKCGVCLSAVIVCQLDNCVGNLIKMYHGFVGVRSEG